MCGVIGVIADVTASVSAELKNGMLALQHRGQDAAGMLVSNGLTALVHKGNGLVNAVFTENVLNQITGNIGLGHVRYRTAGGTDVSAAQPFIILYPFFISMVHNGNLTNYDELLALLPRERRQLLQSKSDSELFLHLFSFELEKAARRLSIQDAICAAIKSMHFRCKGSYAVIMFMHGVGLVAFQDLYAIRPLVFGYKKSTGGYMFASESVALDANGYTLCGDVRPGGAVFVDYARQINFRTISHGKLTPCIFEWVYFADRRSVIHNVPVRYARAKMGILLAEKIQRVWSDLKIDIVVPVPDTSIIPAMWLAATLKLPYMRALHKNTQSGRTFIMYGQENREYLVRKKFSVDIQQVQGKNVLVVDDSIVRGTTSREIVTMLKTAGAANVYFASIAPEIRFPNMYGIDLPTREELIANRCSAADLPIMLGAERVIFQDLDDMTTAVSTKHGFETTMFTGEYLDFTEQVFNLKAAAYMLHLFKMRPVNADDIEQEDFKASKLILRNSTS